jgi:hypothetical protein
MGQYYLMSTKANEEMETPPQKLKLLRPKIILMKTMRPSHRGYPMDIQKSENTNQKPPLIALSTFLTMKYSLSP